MADKAKLIMERVTLFEKLNKINEDAGARVLKADEQRDFNALERKIKTLDAEIMGHVVDSRNAIDSSADPRLLAEANMRPGSAGGDSIGATLRNAVHEVRSGTAGVAYIDVETRTRLEGREQRSVTEDGAFGTMFIQDQQGPATLSLRANSVVLGLPGLRVIPMESNRITLPKIGKDSVQKGVGELVAINESVPESLEVVTLEAVKFAMFKTLSSESIDDSPSAAYAIIVQNMMSSMGLAVDESMLEGLGASDLLGIRNTPGVNLTSIAGTPTDFDDFSDVLYKSEAQDANPTTWILHPRSWNTLAKIKTGIASDNTTLLEPSPQNAARTLLGKPVTQSTQITLVEGAGAGSWVAAVDPTQLVVGVRKAPTLEVSREAAFGSDGVCIRLVARYGFGALNAEGISIATDVRA